MHTSVRILLFLLSLLQLGCFANVGIGNSINSKTLSEVPKDWGFKENIKGKLTGNNAPTILASGLPDSLNAGRAEVFLDSDCKTLAGSAIISSNAFEVNNIAITESYSEMGEKKFYGKYVSSSNLEGKCTDLQLSYYYRPNSSLISSYGSNFTKGPGNSVFIADQPRGQIIHLDLDTNIRTMYYGKGIGSGFNFEFISSMIYAPTGNKLYITDLGLRGIVSLDLESLERNIVSSASVGTGTFFSSPGPIEVNSDETKAYVLDSGLTAFIEVDLASGNRSMLSFPGFVGSGNSYNSGVESIYLTEDDSLIYYVERSANRVSVLDVSTGNNSVVSNGLKGTGTNFDNPYTIMVDATETKAYVLNSDVGGNDFFLEVDFETGNRTVLSSDAVGTGDSIDGAFESVLFNSGSSILVHSLNRALYEVSISTGDRTEKVDFKTVSGSRIRNILTVSNDEQFSYSTHFGSTEVIKTNLLTGSRSVVTSNVIGSGTTIMNINAMKTNSDGSVFYASDSGSSILNSTNTNILRIDSSTGNRTVVASSGVGSGPNFNFPRGIVLTSDDSKAYFVDGNLNALFELNVSTGARTIVSQDGVAGTGPAFNNANNLVLNSAETIAYVTNISGTSVYQVDLSTGNRTVVSSGSVGTGPSLSSPVGIAIDETRNVLYVGSTSSLYTGLIQVDLSTGNRVRLFGEDEKKGPSIYNADHIKYNPTGDYVIAYDNNFEWILKGDLKLGTTSLVVK